MYFSCLLSLWGLCLPSTQNDLCVQSCFLIGKSLKIRELVCQKYGQKYGQGLLQLEGTTSAAHSEMPALSSPATLTQTIPQTGICLLVYLFIWRACCSLTVLIELLSFNLISTEKCPLWHLLILSFT